jgi:hypothetical protein
MALHPVSPSSDQPPMNHSTADLVPLDEQPKILWHKVALRQAAGARQVWPSAAAGIVAISTSQLAYMLDGIDWRNPQQTWRPTPAG